MLEKKDLLEARLADALEKSRKGRVASLSFLTPQEQKRAERLLRSWGVWECAWCWGGYEGAERATLFLLPDYLLECLPLPIDQCAKEELLLLLGESADEITALRISGSGFRKLSHRDYLGTLMGLGLERDSFGDIAVQNESEAVVFLTPAIASFLQTQLERVGGDAVRVSLYQPDGAFTDGRHYAPMTVTVASMRLDCVVAALTDLSREAAQTAIRSGLVELNFEAEERADLSISIPSTLSVRGYGRYLLRSLAGETRKGRLRLLADKLI